MDDIMILMHQIMIDLQSFNESHFGVFDEYDREELSAMWNGRCDRDPAAFVRALGPSQQRAVALWLCDRTSYSVDDLIVALERFTRFLRETRGGDDKQTLARRQADYARSSESIFSRTGDAPALGALLYPSLQRFAQQPPQSSYHGATSPPRLQPPKKKKRTLFSSLSRRK